MYAKNRTREIDGRFFFFHYRELEKFIQKMQIYMKTIDVVVKIL